MSDVITKCSICRAFIDEEDLFCGNCGAEAPPREVTADATTLVTHSFECQGCGASMSYDADAGTLRCPFCGSEGVATETTQRTLAAKSVVAFQVSRDQAESILTKWMGNGFFRPNDLVTAAKVEKMTAVYVPHWVFQASTNTHWTGDTAATPRGARGDWYPLFGSTRSFYSGLVVGASSALTPAETKALVPFDMTAQVPADSLDVSGFVVEQFRVRRKYARPLAREGLEALERAKCAGLIRGKCRNVKVNVRLEGLKSEPVLLPIWMIAFRYREQVYRLLINGQTGTSAGRAPFSYAKLAMVIGIAVAVVAGVMGISAVISGM